METSTCPKCGFPREPRALDCPVCGIVFAKYLSAPAARPAAVPPPVPPALQAPPQMQPPPPGALNPYAPPQANAIGPLPPPLPQPALGNGLWRSGDVLVIRKGSTLPNHCVTCNRPTGNRWQKTFHWVPSWVYFMILAQLLIYLIVYYSVRKSADLALPLCEDHSEKRKRDTALAWLLVCGGLVLMFASIAAADSPRLLTAVFALAIAGVVSGAVFSTRANVVKPVKIDRDHVWLKKVSPDFLAALPEAPFGF
jgi:hypothetical protein